MPPLRSTLLAASSGLLLTGLAALGLTGTDYAEPLPRLPERASSQIVQPMPKVSVERWLGPWAKPAPFATAVPATRTRSPVTVPKEADEKSLQFLGSLTGEGDVKTYLFKVVSAGKVLTLVEGQENQGWTLTAATSQQFSLIGPGGNYVVAR